MFLIPQPPAAGTCQSAGFIANAAPAGRRRTAACPNQLAPVHNEKIIL
jgi:hypothetical protein